MKKLIDGHDLDKITNEIDKVLAKYNLEIVNCTGIFEYPTRFTLKIKEKKENERI